MTQENSAASIALFGGARFYLLSPRQEDIHITDIGHALAMQCRWTGHCKFHYSVAQHSVYCSYLGSDEEALDRLMHDASEAYMADMSRPLKHYTDAGKYYMQQEAIVQQAVRTRYGLGPEPPSVHIADNQMMWTEKEQIMNGPDFSHESQRAIHPYTGESGIKIERWSPDRAEEEFLRRFNELYKGE